MTPRTAFVALAAGLLVLGAVGAATAKPDARPDQANAGQGQDKGPQMKDLKAMAKDLRESARKDRRHVFALGEDLRVHERILNRTQAKIAQLQERLASGNLTGNETKELQDRIQHLETLVQKLEAKVGKVESKMQEVRAKWLEHRRGAGLGKGDDDLKGDAAADDDATSTSTSTTTSAAA